MVSFRKGYLWPNPDRLDRTVQLLEAAVPGAAEQFGWVSSADFWLQAGICLHRAGTVTNVNLGSAQIGVQLALLPLSSLPSLGDRSKLLQQQLSCGSFIKQVLFFCHLVHPSRCCSSIALCVSLLKDMLPAVSWVVAVMATIKT